MNTTETDLAIAGGALASALIETLVAKGILAKADALDVIRKAQAQTGHHKAFGASTVLNYVMQAVNRTSL